MALKNSGILILRKPRPHKEACGQGISAGRDCPSTQRVVWNPVQPKHGPIDRWEDRLAACENLKIGGKRNLTLYFIPQTCDLCGAPFDERRFLVDGALSGSRMGANMCAGCYFAKGTDIVWGEGQLYTQMDDDTWLMTGGFPPLDEE